ncbi:hypothetical protein CK203_109699 [Vitis vinifera]|uniref:Uncharacterized protein n=1 Tax=Vitis vinifera TaxID=29760 RepID=A0A438CBE9_VITVI|nr:hypothetical protein CK203_109699 [Vitis vinifera]
MAVSGLLPHIHSFPSTYQPLRVAFRSPKSPFPNGGFATRLTVKAEAKAKAKAEAKAKAKAKTKTKTTSTATATSVFEDIHTVNIADDVTQGGLFSVLSVEDGILENGDGYLLSVFPHFLANQTKGFCVLGVRDGFGSWVLKS